MSKKLINSPANAVDEALAGLVGANPSLRLLQGHRVVVRADIDSVTEQNKVTLISGGGSGHEPAHAGFVGKGMLSAAVAGGVFASPPSASVLAALRAVASPAGTLVIVKNYTGDRLNFGIAVEQAKMEGMAVKMVVVGEDTALPTTEFSAGRRGLCGIILVHKVAGALAELGATLETVAAFAQQTANAIATLSISLTPCSLPGCKPSFNLNEDEMELGLGIHGEPGAQRIKLKPVDEVVATVFEHMTQQTPGYCYFKPEAGMEVVLVVNNLGGTSNLELLIVTNAAIRYLVDTMNLKVVRVYMGSFMTSLEMAGVSFTLLNVALRSFLEWLDLPVSAPGWPIASTTEREDSHSMPSLTAVVSDQMRLSGEPKTAIGLKMKQCVEEVCSTLLSHEEELNELDRGGGDGDCGTTFKQWALGMCLQSSFVNWDSPQKALLGLAGCTEQNMGGTSGALYTVFFTAAARALLNPELAVSWAQSLKEGTEAVMVYGGAKPGYRTMLDALCPAVDFLIAQLPNCPDHEMMNTLKLAVKAAQTGAEGTVNLKAKAGRASYVPSHQITQRDAGAHAVSLWLKAIHDTLVR